MPNYSKSELLKSIRLQQDKANSPFVKDPVLREVVVNLAVLMEELINRLPHEMEETDSVLIVQRPKEFVYGTFANSEEKKCEE